MKFYRCEHCGNVITHFVDSGVPVVCCGEPMKELTANTTDAAVEKHVPVVKVEDNKVKNVQFVGGCSGNTQGVARLIDGMDIDEAISRIEGIQCGFRPTSCPDQLAQALKEYKANVK